VNNLNIYNKLQPGTLSQVNCGHFVGSYAPPEKNVPFSHFRTGLFSVRRNLLPAAGRRGIFAVLAALLTLLFLFPAPVSGAETLPLEELIAKTQEIYEKTADLRARFVQEAAIRSMKKTEREEGVVFFKNPRMMLWDYRKPKAKKLVIDARKAWLYIPEDRVVYVQNAEEVFRSGPAVKFLSGIGKLSEDFQIRFTKDAPRDARGNYLLTLTAKEAGSPIDRLDLTIDGNSYQISQVRFGDAYGNTTRIDFFDIRVNTGLSDALFRFQPPAGVEVIPVPQSQ
jgi:outer membrane lipoprotein carrier protein